MNISFMHITLPYYTLIYCCFSCRKVISPTGCPVHRSCRPRYLPEVYALCGQCHLDVAVPADVDVVALEDLFAPAVVDDRGGIHPPACSHPGRRCCWPSRDPAWVVGINDTPPLGPPGSGLNTVGKSISPLGITFTARQDQAVDAVIVPGHQLHILPSFGKVYVRGIMRHWRSYPVWDRRPPGNPRSPSR